MPYVIRPQIKAWWDAEYCEPINPPSIQIEPTDARKTGLLTARGEDIWNAPDPIGFRFAEQEKG